MAFEMKDRLQALKHGVGVSECTYQLAGPPAERSPWLIHEAFWSAEWASSKAGLVLVVRYSWERRGARCACRLQRERQGRTDGVCGSAETLHSDIERMLYRLSRSDSGRQTGRGLSLFLSLFWLVTQLEVTQLELPIPLTSPYTPLSSLYPSLPPLSLPAPPSSMPHSQYCTSSLCTRNWLFCAITQAWPIMYVCIYRNITQFA